MKLAAVICLAFAGSSVAYAQDQPKVAPDPGRDKAPLHAAPWCNGLKEKSEYRVDFVRMGIEEAMKDWPQIYKPARDLCAAKPDDPVAQQQVQAVEQFWINFTGLSQKDADASIAARLDEAQIKADKDKLCGELKVSDEVLGEDRAFMNTKSVLFGCQGSYAMWSDNDQQVPRDLPLFLDVSATEPDELVRLASILQSTRMRFANADYFEKALAQSYPSDQLDYQAFKPDAAMKMLDTAPYQGNSWARVVVMESVGHAKAGIEGVEAEVKKRTSKDADWKELLITAPQRGAAEWRASAGKWKAELARSNEFEHKYFGPSKRAVRGCLPELRGDFEKVAKTLKHDTAHDLVESLSEPIASLLFQRLVVCIALDDDPNWAGKLYAIGTDLRYARGPRVAAYWATVEALGKILADRERFPVKLDNMYGFKDRMLYDAALNEQNHNKRKDIDQMGFVGDSGFGVVGTIKKGASGLEVEFVKVRHQEMGFSCIDTNHLLAIRANGTLQYRQICHNTGLYWVDRTPGGVTVPAEWAGAIAAGHVLDFMTERGQPPKRRALPVTIYSDKSRKKLLNWMGFTL